MTPCAPARCAWCEEATGELVVPGARGAYVHPSCEAKRRGRRSFLVGAAVLAGAAAAAPLLELVPEAASKAYTLTASYYPPLVTPNAGEWVWYMHPSQYEAFKKLGEELGQPIGLAVKWAAVPPGRAYRMRKAPTEKPAIDVSDIWTVAP